MIQMLLYSAQNVITKYEYMGNPTVFVINTLGLLIPKNPYIEYFKYTSNGSV